MIEYAIDMVKRLLLIFSQCVYNKSCIWQLNCAMCLMITEELQLNTIARFYHIEEFI